MPCDRCGPWKSEHAAYRRQLSGDHRRELQEAEKGSEYGDRIEAEDLRSSGLALQNIIGEIERAGYFHEAVFWVL